MTSGAQIRSPHERGIGKPLSPAAVERPEETLKGLEDMSWPYLATSPITLPPKGSMEMRTLRAPTMASISHIGPRASVATNVAC